MVRTVSYYTLSLDNLGSFCHGARTLQPYILAWCQYSVIKCGFCSLFSIATIGLVILIYFLLRSDCLFPSCKESDVIYSEFFSLLFWSLLIVVLFVVEGLTISSKMFFFYYVNLFTNLSNYSCSKVHLIARNQIETIKILIGQTNRNNN